MKHKLILALAVILLLAFTILGVTNVRTSNQKIQFQEIELKDNSVKLKNLNEEYDKLLESKEVDQQKLDELQKQKEQLEKDLQAKLEKQEAERVALEQASKLTTKVSAAEAKPAPRAVTVTGNKHDWLVASGIPESEWWAVDSIVSRESGWNPNAVNKSSGACGLGQQLPCGKWAGAWNDPVAALKAQYGYVVARYGGYPQAVAFWNANHWY